MASPHAAGALALLASNTLPARDAAAVDALYATVIGAGNDVWTDESGDGTKEPLLDVSNVDIFAPTLIPTVSTDAAPTVTISSPFGWMQQFESAVSISFAASATDPETGQPQWRVSSGAHPALIQGPQAHSAWFCLLVHTPSPPQSPTQPITPTLTRSPSPCNR